MSAAVTQPCQDPFVLQVSEFNRVRKLVHSFCGVDLTGKQVLVDSRLRRKVQELGFPSLDAYLAQVQGDQRSALFSGFIDLLTTNHTSFFREVQHFDLLKGRILPDLPAGTRIRIWSAACSSGEEPYTIAFTLFESLGEAAFKRSEILATDISTRVLEKAKRGLYPLDALSAVSSPVRRRCLLKGTGAYDGQCLMKREVRDLITFRHFNLLEDCSPFGHFDVIFCRNVMIYFDGETQEQLVNRLAARLHPGGYLLIGHSESLKGLQQPLQYVSPATYRKAQTVASTERPAATAPQRTR